MRQKLADLGGAVVIGSGTRSPWSSGRHDDDAIRGTVEGVLDKVYKVRLRSGRILAATIVLERKTQGSITIEHVVHCLKGKVMKQGLRCAAAPQTDGSWTERLP
jgi:hypothetical protein